MNIIHCLVLLLIFIFLFRKKNNKNNLVVKKKLPQLGLIRQEGNVLVLGTGNKGLIILLAASKEVVLNNEEGYYQSIAPYVKDYTIVTYDLPHHKKVTGGHSEVKDPPLEIWGTDPTVLEKNNLLLNDIIKKYKIPGKPVILSGISRGGYLSSMYPNADYYFLFSPVINLRKLKEYKNATFPEADQYVDENSFTGKKLFIYINSDDTRVGGDWIIKHMTDVVGVNKNGKNHKMMTGKGGHTTPRDIFKKAVKHFSL